MAADKPGIDGDTPDTEHPEGQVDATNEEELEEEDLEEEELEEEEYEGDEDEEEGDEEEGDESEDEGDEEDDQEEKGKSGLLGRVFSRKKRNAEYDPDVEGEEEDDSDHEESDEEDLGDDTEEEDEGEEEAKPKKSSVMSRMFSKKRPKDSGDSGDNSDEMDESDENSDDSDEIEEDHDSEEIEEDHDSEEEEKPARKGMFSKMLSRKGKNDSEEEEEEEGDEGESEESEPKPKMLSRVFSRKQKDSDEESEEDHEDHDDSEGESEEDLVEDHDDSETEPDEGYDEDHEDGDHEDGNSDEEPKKRGKLAGIFSKKKKGTDEVDADQEPSVSKLAAIASVLSLARRRKGTSSSKEGSKDISGKVENVVGKLLKRRDASEGETSSGSSSGVWNALSQMFRRPMGIPALRWSSKGRSSLLEIAGQKFAVGLFWSLDTSPWSEVKEESKRTVALQIKSVKSLMKDQDLESSGDAVPDQTEIDDLYAFSRVQPDKKSGSDLFQYGRGSSGLGIRPMMPSLGACMSGFLQEVLLTVRKKGARYESTVAAFEVPSLRSNGDMVGNGYYLIAVDRNGCILPGSDICLRSSKIATDWIERFRHQNPNPYLIAPASLGIPNSVELDLDDCFISEDFCLEEPFTRLRGVDYAIFRALVYGFFGLLGMLLLLTGLGIYDDYQISQEAKERQERNVQLHNVRQVQDKLDALKDDLASADLELLDIQTVPWATPNNLLKPKYFLQECFNGIRSVDLAEAPLGLRFLNLYCNVDSSGSKFEIGVNWGSLFQSNSALTEGLDLGEDGILGGSGVLSRKDIDSKAGQLEGLTPLRAEWDAESRAVSLSRLLQTEEASRTVEWEDLLESVEAVYDTAAEGYYGMKWSRDQAVLGQIPNGLVIWVQAGGSFTAPPLGESGIVAISSLLGELSGFVVESVSLDISSGDWKISGWVGVETPSYATVARNLRNRVAKRSELESEITLLEKRLRELEAQEE